VCVLPLRRTPQEQPQSAAKASKGRLECGSTAQVQQGDGGWREGMSRSDAAAEREESTG